MWLWQGAGPGVFLHSPGGDAWWISTLVESCGALRWGPSQALIVLWRRCPDHESVVAGVSVKSWQLMSEQAVLLDVAICWRLSAFFGLSCCLCAVVQGTHSSRQSAMVNERPRFWDPPAENPRLKGGDQ